jgi:hypothetical protein
VTRRAALGAARRWLAIAALLLAAPAAALAAPAALSFDSESCDLGSVVQGEQADCEFSFGNAGGEELRILSVEPSCGCTTALLSAPLLRAGERGRIRVVFDSENFTGEVVKEVEVRSSDPARSRLTLRVRALVAAEVDFEPRTVAFDDARAGAALLQVVMLTNRRPEAVKILRLEAAPASYRCLLPSWTDRSQPLTVESWDRVAIEVRFDHPGPLAMPIPGECTLAIEGPRKKNFTLKLLALPAP